MLAAVAVGSCSYLQDRVHDLHDVFTADVGVGFGIGVDFQVTDAVHSGLGGGVYYVLQLGQPTLSQLNSELAGLQSAYAFVLYRSSGPRRSAWRPT